MLKLYSQRVTLWSLPILAYILLLMCGGGTNALPLKKALAEQDAFVKHRLNDAGGRQLWIF